MESCLDKGESMKRKSTLSDWELVSMGDWFQLRGRVLNDDRFSDRDMIHTSMVLRVDFEKGIAETRNTEYKLV